MVGFVNVPGYPHLVVTADMELGWCYNTLSNECEPIPLAPPPPVGLQHQPSFLAGVAQPTPYSSMAPSGQAASYQQPWGIQQPQQFTAGPVQPGPYPSSQPVGLQHRQVFSTGVAQPTLYSPMASLGRATSYQQPRGFQQPQQFVTSPAQPGSYLPSQSVGFQHQQVSSTGPVQHGLYPPFVASSGQATSHQQPWGLQQPQQFATGPAQPGSYLPSQPAGYQHQQVFSAGPAQPGLYSSPVAPYGQTASHQQPRGLQQPHQSSFAVAAQPAPQAFNGPVMQNVRQTSNMSDNEHVRAMGAWTQQMPIRENTNGTGPSAAPAQGPSSAPKVVIDFTGDDDDEREVEEFVEEPSTMWVTSCPQLRQRLVYISSRAQSGPTTYMGLLQCSMYQDRHREGLKKYCNRFWPSDEEALADVREMARYFIDAQKMFWIHGVWDDAATAEEMADVVLQKRALAAGLSKEKDEEIERRRVRAEMVAIARLSKTKRAKKEAAQRAKEAAAAEKKAQKEAKAEEKRVQAAEKRAQAEAKLQEKKRKRADALAAPKTKRVKSTPAPPPAPISVPAAAAEPVEEEDLLAAFDAFPPSPVPAAAAANPIAEEDLLAAFEAFPASPSPAPEEESTLLAAFAEDESENGDDFASELVIEDPEEGNTSSGDIPTALALQEQVPSPPISPLLPLAQRATSDDDEEGFGTPPVPSSPLVVARGPQEEVALRTPPASQTPSPLVAEDDDLGSLFGDDEAGSLFGDDNVGSLFEDDEVNSLFEDDNLGSLFGDEEEAVPSPPAPAPVVEDDNDDAADSLFGDPDPSLEEDEPEEEEEEEESEEVQCWRRRCEVARSEVAVKEAARVELCGRRDFLAHALLKKRFDKSIEKAEAEKAEKERELQVLLDSAPRGSRGVGGSE
ncbi:hypothetical protein P153DRAFT_433316 [Dothidotthia symphoricarpi CBS 119687]|uniref:Uncharacterized protein n=1 Tax=Dothidotthia symphoricarpi CBS 119687 TaxID=1392245 RepID=A0A6A6A6V8_9PLEO|nr:uncharacterized protein P153DRAFT_433316 [Dothidotthia symphoricarpi CBS 119687]KAF2126804.1 hypothetical protein P153DRAFT_433316 [Dothidotthia symphoricarpi CBS 119687]